MLSFVLWILSRITRDRLNVHPYRKFRHQKKIVISFLIFDLFFTSFVAFKTEQFLVNNSWAAERKFQFSHPEFNKYQNKKISELLISEPGHTYWIGNDNSYTYDIDNIKDTLSVVRYIPKGKTLALIPLPEITVRSFRTKEDYFSYGVNISSTEKISFITSGGSKVEINPREQNFEVITFIKKKDIVTIAFSSPQSMETLINRAKAIRPLI